MAARTLLVSHHAFVVECGSSDAFTQIVREIAETLRADGTVVDVWNRAYRILQIQDSDTKEWYVDEIQTRARDRVDSGAVRLVAVYAGRITTEAQNALLKVLEEPAESTKIVICVPSVAELLPTILSRVMVLASERENFFPKSLAERLQNAVRETEDFSERSVSRERESVTGKGKKAKKEKKIFTTAEIIVLPKKDRLEALEDMLEEKDIARMRSLVHGCIDTLFVYEKDGKVDAKKRISLQTKFAHIDTLLANGAAPKFLVQTVVLLMP